MQLTITGFESPRHLLAIEQFVAAIRAANEAEGVPDDADVTLASQTGLTASATTTEAPAPRKRRTKAEIEAARAAEATPTPTPEPQPEPAAAVQQPVVTPEPAPQVEQPQPEQAPSPVESGVKVEKADVQKALSDLCAKTSMPVCQELLKKYGATAVRELKESDYAAFKAEADKMIAGAA